MAIPLPVARLGDKSSHGGTIITSGQKMICEGIKVARVTDLHSCPIPFHGVTPIVTGSPNHIVEGQQCARGNGGQGSVTGCGAIIIGGAIQTFTD